MLLLVLVPKISCSASIFGAIGLNPTIFLPRIGESVASGIPFTFQHHLNFVYVGN